MKKATDNIVAMTSSQDDFTTKNQKSRKQEIMMKKLIVLLALLALVACLSTSAFAGNAFGAFSLTNGSLSQLQLVSEASYTSGTIYSTWLGTQKSVNAVWGQPLLKLTQNNVTQGYGMCIDSFTTINTGTVYTAYNVKDWDTAPAGAVAIEDKVAWNKLKYMWQMATVTGTNNLDRTALQLATWKGAAGDWVGDVTANVGGRANFWTTYDGVASTANAQFRLGALTLGNATLIAKAESYLAFGRSYTNTVDVNGYKLVVDGYQNFAVWDGTVDTPPQNPVPEASTLIGFGSALVMAAPGMVGWLKRRRS